MNKQLNYIYIGKTLKPSWIWVFILTMHRRPMAICVFFPYFFRVVIIEKWNLKIILYAHDQCLYGYGFSLL